MKQKARDERSEAMEMNAWRAEEAVERRLQETALVAVLCFGRVSWLLGLDLHLVFLLFCPCLAPCFLGPGLELHLVSWAPGLELHLVS